MLVLILGKYLGTVSTACATNLDLAAGQFKCAVWINHLSTKTLLDYSIMVTLVHTGSVYPWGYQGEPPGSSVHCLWLYLGDIRGWDGKQYTKKKLR